MVSLHSHIKWKALAALDMTFISQWKQNEKQTEQRGRSYTLPEHYTAIFLWLWEIIIKSDSRPIFRQGFFVEQLPLTLAMLCT